MSPVLKKRVVQFFWAVPLLFYLITMAKTIGYVDAALILNNAHKLSISAWVNNHNLFSVLGWLWMKIIPVGSEFFRINLLSAIFGTFTVYFIFLTCLGYIRTLWISVLTAVALMTSHSLWWHSTMLEVYSLNTLLIALILYAVMKYFEHHHKIWIYASLFFWGLGISNHVLMGLLAPAFMVLLIIERKNLSLADITISLCALALGLSVFLWACTKSYLYHHSVLKVVDLLTGSEFRSLMFSSTPKLFWRLNYLLLLIYQYPSVIAFFLFYGTVFLFVQPRKLDLFVIAALVPQIIWSANYFVWDMYAFSLPVYMLLSLAICKGIHLFRQKRILILICCISMVIPVFLYNNIDKIPPVRNFVGRYPMIEMVKGSFDPVRYFLNPEKSRFNSVDRYVQDLFNTLPKNASYFDSAYDYPILFYYQQIREQRPDLYCPVIFAFWIAEEEKTSVAGQINAKIRLKEPVYLSSFVYTLLEPKLQSQRIDRIVIQDHTIYRLR